VHSAIDLSSEEQVAATLLPPLVVKIARRDRCTYIAREAWFYDEMESLQGVCIPRCYGWFDAVIPDGDQVDVWGGQTFKGDSMVWPAGLLRDLSHARNRVSLLLLERLGEELPLNDPQVKKLEREFYNMYKDLCVLGIEHQDIRHANILHAPTGPNALPGRPSPYLERTTGKEVVSQWRLIDFELSKKSNYMLYWKGHPREAVQDPPGFDWVVAILEGLPLGYIVEPWE